MHTWQYTGNTDGVHSGRGRLATIMVGKAMARVKVQLWAVGLLLGPSFVCLFVYWYVKSRNMATFYVHLWLDGSDLNP